MTGEPHVIGVDPSLTCTGIASSQGWVDTVGAKGVTALPVPERVDTIDRLAWDIIMLIRRADLIVIEEPLPSGATSADRSGLERHALAWLLLRWLVRNEVPFALVNNRHRTTYATGNAAGRKIDVLNAAAEFWPAWKAGRNDNKADAVVLMALGRHALGHPVGEVPPLNTRVIEQIEWPVDQVKARVAARQQAAKRSGTRVCEIPGCGCGADAHP